MVSKRLQIRRVLDEVNEKMLFFFTPKIIAQAFNTTLQRATIFLSLNTKRGYFVRLKKGIYALSTQQPTPLEVANLVYKPSYISLETALSYYHILPETVYSTTSITTKHSKTITIFNQIFSYHKLSKQLYFGYEVVRVGTKQILMATKEKALLDYLYFVAIGQKQVNNRLDVRTIDTKRLSEYEKVFWKSINNTFITKKFKSLLKQFYA